jgi:hypothetical protein
VSNSKSKNSEKNKSYSSEKLFKQLSDPNIKNVLNKNPHIYQMASLLSLHPEDKHIMEQLEIYLNQINNAVNLSPDPYIANYPDDDSKIKYESFIQLGITSNNIPAGIDINQIPQNGIISGSTGTGKTSLLSNILVNQELLYTHRVFILVRKKELRHLLSIPEIAPLLYVLTPKDIAISILQPWQNGMESEIINMLSRSFALAFNKIAAQNYFSEKLHELMKLFAKGSYPTLEQITHYVSQRDDGKYNYRRDQLKESCVTSLKAILNNIGSGMWNYSYSDMLKVLFSTPGLAIIELEGIDPQVLSFISIYLMYWRYYQVHYLGSESIGDLPALFVLDDATPSVQREADRNAPGGIGPIGDITTMSRSADQGTIVIPHSLDNTSEPIIQNSGFIIVTGSRGESPFKLKNILNINDSQIDYLKTMPQNQALIYNSYLYDLPIIFEYSPVSGAGFVTDAQCKKSLKQLKYFVTTKPPVKPLQLSIDNNINPNPASKDVIDLLGIICSTPHLSITAAYKKAGLNSSQGVRVKRLLIRNQYAREFKYSTGTVGGMISVLIATDKGRKLVSCKHKPLTNGGPEHEMAAFAVTAGYDPAIWHIEYEVTVLPGLRMDIVTTNKRDNSKDYVNIGISRAENELNHFLSFVNYSSHSNFILICRDTRFRKRFLNLLKKHKNHNHLKKTITCKLLAEYILR